MASNIFQPRTVPGSEKIREILARRVDQQKQAVGIVAGIIEPDARRVVAWGYLGKGDSRTVGGDTIFEIGSATKVFTALLLADMVNRGEVRLDDPASTYLPDSVTVPGRSGKLITLLDLCTHSSGLPSLPANLKPKDPRNPYADYRVEDLYEFLSGYTLSRDPGSEFEYSNLGAGLLGHLLASRIGTDYESAIRIRITEPLGMPDTAIALSSSMKQRMATGHNAMLAPVAYWDLPTLAGAGALRSSANDMLTFLEAFLGYRESPLAPAMNAMLDVRRPMGKMEIGLAWFLIGEGAWHGGATGGFRAFLGCEPKAGIGVVVLSNAATPIGVDDIGGHLLNQKVPLSDIEPRQQRTEIPIDPQLLNRYTGRYQVMPHLILEITREGDSLFAQAVGPTMSAPKFEVFAESDRKFFAKVSDKQIVFDTGPDGRVTGLTLYGAGGQPMTATRVS
jgi:serine-type D-Ala-D-Ala carboxypeptidase/endopeptidase